MHSGSYVYYYPRKPVRGRRPLISIHHNTLAAAVADAFGLLDRKATGKVDIATHDPERGWHHFATAT